LWRQLNQGKKAPGHQEDVGPWHEAKDGDKKLKKDDTKALAHETGMIGLGGGQEEQHQQSGGSEQQVCTVEAPATHKLLA
jgi:hypothetical protein